MENTVDARTIKSPSQAPTLNTRDVRKPSLRLWWFLVISGLVAWIIAAVIFDYWPLIREYWTMAVVMIGGSVVGGSTAMRVGLVSFPILVSLFGDPAENGRWVGLAIQADGMTPGRV